MLACGITSRSADPCSVDGEAKNHTPHAPYQRYRSGPGRQLPRVIGVVIQWRAAGSRNANCLICTSDNEDPRLTARITARRRAEQFGVWRGYRASRRGLNRCIYKQGIDSLAPAVIMHQTFVTWDVDFWRLTERALGVCKPQLD